MRPHSNCDGSRLRMDIDCGGIIRHIVVHVDFGRTARTFICFGAHSNVGVLLLGYNDRNYTCKRLPLYMQPHCNGDGSRLLIDIDCGGIYDALLVMLTLHEQRVRLFVLVLIRIWMCCCLVTKIAITHATVCNYTCNRTAMATAHDSGWILIAVKYTTHCYSY